MLAVRFWPLLVVSKGRSSHSFVGRGLIDSVYIAERYMIISVHATTCLSGTVILICIIRGYLRPYQPALALADYKSYYICVITITALIVWASVPLPHGVTYADFELPDLFFQLHQPVDIPPVKLFSSFNTYSFSS